MKIQKQKMPRDDFDLNLTELNSKGIEQIDGYVFYDEKELACRLTKCRQRNAELKRVRESKP